VPVRSVSIMAPIQRNDAQRFGRDSELRAARFLQQSGYRIVARNYRTPFGEIDLIAYDGPVLVFIEVKARRGERFGSPYAAVDARKQRRLTRAALGYLARIRSGRGASGPSEPACRFDLVVIDAAPASNPSDGRIELLQNMFTPAGSGL
jgi:putative endonuclease